MATSRIFTLAVVLGLLTGASSAFADAESHNNVSAANTEQLLQKMTRQTQALENQMTVLKRQIRQLKIQQRHLEHPAVHRTSTIVMAGAPKPKSRLITNPTGNTNLKGQTPPISELTTARVNIAPYLGDHLAFNASDLVVNYSSYNEDLALLQLRDKIYHSEPAALSPSLMFSGKVEGQAIYQKPFNGGHTSKFDLSGAEIDVIPMINQWASGFLGIKYDNSAPAAGPVVSNSRVFIDRAFLTIGNLSRFPLYMTLGQTYLPFGTYSTNLIAAPLTEIMFQTKGRALILGYDNPAGQGIYGQIYGFGGSASAGNANNINNLGANLGLTFNGNNWNIDTGIGAISDVADSLGMQQTGAPTGFAGFSETQSPVTLKTNHLQRQVPGLATHFNIGIDHFGVNAEYVNATSSFAYQDMTFDEGSAKPHALHTEAYYNFHVFERPSVVTLGFDHTWEGLALNVPQRSYIINFTTSIWKDAIEQIEFNHSQNYKLSDSASGSMVDVPVEQKGGSSNTVTAQFGVYF